MIKYIDLSGNWDLFLDYDKAFSDDISEIKYSDTISLPGTTSQAKKGNYNDAKEIEFLTDPYLFEGHAYYRKQVEIPKEYLGKDIYFHIERTRMTKVWIDNTLIGDCDTLTTPHEYKLSDYVKGETFTLTVLVANVGYPTKGGHLTSPDTQTNWNGMIGNIGLKIYDMIYIKSIKTFPDADKKEIKVVVNTVNNTGKEMDIVLETAVAPVSEEFYGASLGQENAHTHDDCDECMGHECEKAETDCSKCTLKGNCEHASGDDACASPEYSFGEMTDITVPVGEGVCEYIYTCPDMALWSEYSPVSYDLRVMIYGNFEEEHTIMGMRKFHTTDTEFLINDEKTFLRGKHDGLIFPLTGAVPATVSEWLKVMKISKSYGINHYRFHTCCPPEAAFTAADILGIYMEPELPFWGTLTAPTDENHNATEQDYLISEGFKMMEAFGNHPSFCMMSLGNELWGSKERIAEIIRNYKAVDTRHLYTQGSNNFQHVPVILPEDDFYVGVRFAKNRLIRGSYGMCDAPLGHIQWDEPATSHNYDEEIRPTMSDVSGAGGETEIEIQYGTGVKKVKAAAQEDILLSNVPVVTHEIGQFAVYPNFREIDKYTGVLKARNFEVFKERLAEKGMLDQADDFFFTSGKLSVQCYKEELEAAARSSLVAGYQILDIQDFSGQGTALVGILDAFMESKGHVTKEEWEGFCSEKILLAEFPKFVYSSSEEFRAVIRTRYYSRESLVGKKVCCEISEIKDYGIEKTGAKYSPVLDTPIFTQEFEVSEDIKGLITLGEMSFKLPAAEKSKAYRLTLTLDDTSNVYEFYVYPDKNACDISSVSYIGEGENRVRICKNFAELKDAVSTKEKILLLPKETKECIEGFYCTDFWCYPMFRGICEWMKKPVAVGTMGLMIDETHPAVSGMLSHKYSTPQWYQIVSNSDCAILDEATEKDYRPILQMVDNFERNHKLGILFEGMIKESPVMILTSKISDIKERPEVKQFVASVLDYVTSDKFAPEKVLELDKLENLFS